MYYNNTYGSTYIDRTAVPLNTRSTLTFVRCRYYHVLGMWRYDGLTVYTIGLGSARLRSDLHWPHANPMEGCTLQVAVNSQRVGRSRPVGNDPGLGNPHRADYDPHVLFTHCFYSINMCSDIKLMLDKLGHAP